LRARDVSETSRGCAAASAGWAGPPSRPTARREEERLGPNRGRKRADFGPKENILFLFLFFPIFQLHFQMIFEIIFFLK
jgi:hypothetical protein